MYIIDSNSAPQCCRGSCFTAPRTPILLRASNKIYLFALPQIDNARGGVAKQADGARTVATARKERITKITSQ